MHKPVPDPNLTPAVCRRWSPIAGEAVAGCQSPEKPSLEKDDVVVAPHDVCSIFAGCSYQKWWPFVAVTAGCPQHRHRAIQHRRSRLAHLEASRGQPLKKTFENPVTIVMSICIKKGKNSATNHLKDLQLTKRKLHHWKKKSATKLLWVCVKKETNMLPTLLGFAHQERKFGS
jgi:hypothetical protein